MSSFCRWPSALWLTAALAAACAVPGGGAHGAAVSGKYCIDDGSTMLLTRAAANGRLEFGMSSWNPQGNYFGVFGTAEPDRGGWRFRDSMTAADPADRCEVLLGRLPDGGYSFSVTAAGSCQSDGGFNAAPLPNQKILFPARSRQGPMPRGKSMAQAMSLESGGIACAKPASGR